MTKQQAFLQIINIFKMHHGLKYFMLGRGFLLINGFYQKEWNYHMSLLKKYKVLFPWKQRLSRDDVNVKNIKEIY